MADATPVKPRCSTVGGLEEAVTVLAAAHPSTLAVGALQWHRQQLALTDLRVPWMRLPQPRAPSLE